jgi:hypothetical protein
MRHPDSTGNDLQVACTPLQGITPTRPRPRVTIATSIQSTSIDSCSGSRRHGHYRPGNVPSTFLGGFSVAGEYLKLATLRCGDDQQWVVGSRKHFRWLPLCFAHTRRYADLHAAVLELVVESVRVE